MNRMGLKRTVTDVFCETVLLGDGVPATFRFLTKPYRNAAGDTFDERRIDAKPFVEVHAEPAVFDGTFGRIVEDRNIAAQLAGEAFNVGKVAKGPQSNSFRPYVEEAFDQFFVCITPTGNGDDRVNPETDRVSGFFDFPGGGNTLFDRRGGLFVRFGDGRRVYRERNYRLAVVLEFEQLPDVIRLREEEKFVAVLSRERRDEEAAKVRDVVEGETVGEFAGVQDRRLGTLEELPYFERQVVDVLENHGFDLTPKSQLEVTI